MTDATALQRLLTWLSPAFPVGSFAWSQGLETAIADGRVTDAASLKDWIGGSLAHGVLKTDAILLAQAWKLEADSGALREIAELGLALTAASLWAANDRSFAWWHIAAVPALVAAVSGTLYALLARFPALSRPTPAT